MCNAFKMIIFTKHALQKFETLRQYKMEIPISKVIATVENPDTTDYSRPPLLIAQGKIDNGHVLRVVYKNQGDNSIIITFYPGNIKRYQ
jgi:hypothetical protein